MNRRTLPALLAAAALSLPLCTLLIPTAQAAADGCDVGVESDVNGDGWTDAVVGDPYATVDGVEQAGRVTVLYGDSDGRVGEGGRATVRQGLDNVLGDPEERDRFGSALAVANLDCDGYADLVVGVPYEDLSGKTDSGLVQIIYGSLGGLGAGKVSSSLYQPSFGYPVHSGDRLGYAVDALEDVGQGGTPAPDAYAVAVGAPGWDVDGAADAGWVGFKVAVDGGTDTLSVTQNSPGLPGAAEAGDRFGSAVTLNYLVGSQGTVDAAVGVPGEDIGSITDAGSVVVVKDIYDDPTGVGLDQSSAGISGDPESGDRFGESLDSVRVGSTTRLAVGVSHEDVGSAKDAGSVQLFSSNGATLTPTTSLSQNTSGVGGVAETGDRFGDRLAFAAPGPGVSSTRLAVGVPGEDGVAVDNGLVQVFPVNDLGAEKGYGQDTPGVPGTPQAGDRFGASVAVVTGARSRRCWSGCPTTSAPAPVWSM